MRQESTKHIKYRTPSHPRTCHCTIKWTLYSSVRSSLTSVALCEYSTFRKQSETEIDKHRALSNPSRNHVSSSSASQPNSPAASSPAAPGSTTPARSKPITPDPTTPRTSPVDYNNSPVSTSPISVPILSNSEDSHPRTRTAISARERLCPNHSEEAPTA